MFLLCYMRIILYDVKKYNCLINTLFILNININIYIFKNIIIYNF